MVSRELEKECVVVFDEAHNIDNVCIEVAKSVQSLNLHDMGLQKDVICLSPMPLHQQVL